jgi:hypothetical protein
VVIALLMRDRKMSFDDALKFVQEKRSKVKPNEAFEQQLRAMQPQLQLLHQSQSQSHHGDLAAMASAGGAGGAGGGGGGSD